MDCKQSNYLNTNSGGRRRTNLSKPKSTHTLSSDPPVYSFFLSSKIFDAIQACIAKDALIILKKCRTRTFFHHSLLLNNLSEDTLESF